MLNTYPAWERITFRVFLQNPLEAPLFKCVMDSLLGEYVLYLQLLSCTVTGMSMY